MNRSNDDRRNGNEAHQPQPGDLTRERQPQQEREQQRPTQPSAGRPRDDRGRFTPAGVKPGQRRAPARTK